MACETAPTVVALRSGNAKTGPIPTTSRPQTTCPTDCPLRGSGCYGENRGAMGRPSLFGTVDRSPARVPVDDIATRAPKGAPAVRFNVVGDYLRADGTPDREYIDATNRVAAARPWVAIAYTHAWRSLSPDLFAYTVRASCQSAEEAEEASAAGWVPVVVAEDASDPIIGSTIAGRRVVACPVTTGRAASCADCRLCGRTTAVVAFPVHGARRARARAVVAAARA